MKVKRIFITALVILVAYVLQCTVFPVLDIAGIKPNLLLIVTASFGFMRGSKVRNARRIFIGTFRLIYNLER